MRRVQDVRCTCSFRNWSRYKKDSRPEGEDSKMRDRGEKRQMNCGCFEKGVKCVISGLGVFSPRLLAFGFYSLCSIRRFV